jgi:hypothetical protein
LIAQSKPEGELSIVSQSTPPRRGSNWSIATSHRLRLWWVGVVLSLVASCGSRTIIGIDSDAADAAPAASRTGTQPPSTTSLPTCAEICDRLVSLCVGGATSQPCVRDCEAGLAGTSACSDELSAFLRCMETTRVQCMPNDVIVIVDCSDERLALERCRRP